MPPPDCKSPADERERHAAALRQWFEREIADLRAEMANERRECNAILAEASRLHRIITAMRVMEPDLNTWMH